MEPNAAGAAAQTTPPASPPAAPPPPPASPPPAPVPNSGLGGSGSGAASGAGAGHPTPGVAQPNPAAPADQWASLSPQQRTQIAQWQQASQELQQYRPYIPLGYAAYQQQMQGRQQPQGGIPAQPQPTNPWGLPTISRDLLNYVDRDPATGRLVTRPGGPPDAAIQVEAYQQKLQDVQWELFNNPSKLLGPMIQQEAQKVAQQMFQQQFGQVQQQQQAQQVLQQNRDWLFEKDATGQQLQVFDPSTGGYRPKLSGWGQYYAQVVQHLDSSGVKDPGTQHQLAMSQLQNAWYQQQQRQQQAPAQGQAAAQQFLNQAGQAPPGIVTPPAQVQPNAQPAPTGETVRQAMARAFAANGINDQSLQQQFSRVGSAA